MILNKKSNFKMKLDFLFILYFMIILKFIYITINVQNYFQLISSYKIPMQKEKTLTQILV